MILQYNILLKHPVGCYIFAATTNISLDNLQKLKYEILGSNLEIGGTKNERKTHPPHATLYIFF